MRKFRIFALFRIMLRRFCFGVLCRSSGVLWGLGWCDRRAWIGVVGFGFSAPTCCTVYAMGRDTGLTGGLRGGLNGLVPMAVKAGERQHHR